MNVVLWVLQILLALHTLMGAFWKLKNSEQSVPSLRALPHAVWAALTPIEIALAAALVLPAAVPSLAVLAPVGALALVAEMLLFAALHARSGETRHGELVYWLVVAALGAFVAVGRLTLSPVA